VVVRLVGGKKGVVARWWRVLPSRDWWARVTVARRVHHAAGGCQRVVERLVARKCVAA